MAQIPKYIDITKTFIPVDPNSFPETLTAPGNDASPEERIPAMAYKGYNFMPTPYGYKSYFGVNQTLNVNAVPGNVDELFIFQNALLENVLLALTDTGVWVKKGTSTGNWQQLVTYTAPVDGSHLLWTYVIIADKLYVYQQGRPTYWMVDSHLTAGVTLTSKAPTFLAMTYQVGIFRAAGRLAFWDVTDSIGWSNLDDFTDFSPSLETLAGNATFADVQGRIITVLSHGEGFIIYSSKSIVYISEDTANLYQFRPAVILPSTGIQYPRQATVASPDTLHFAYTTEGLKKIQNAKQETIVTEITDFLKDSKLPIYLKILEGRFLFLEMMNPEYVIGKVQHGEKEIPPEEYKFDGSQYELAKVVIPGVPADSCPIFDGIDNGKFTDVVPGGSKSPTLPAVLPAPHPTSPNYKPEWTCYIASTGVADPANIEWGPTPCPTIDPNGKEVNMCPINVKTISALTTNATNKRAVKGSDAYLDGTWTMERFMAVQSAIWEAEDQAIEATIAAIEGRAKQVMKISEATTCTPTTLPLTRDICQLGRYPSKFTAPKFGYNACSFWLTRYAVEARDIQRVMTNSVACAAATENDIIGSLAILTPTSSTLVGGLVQPMEGSKEAIAAASVAARNVYQQENYHPNTFTCIYEEAFWGQGPNLTPTAGMQVSIHGVGSTKSTDGGGSHGSGTGLTIISASIICPEGFLPYFDGVNPMCRISTPKIQKTETMSAYNEGVDAAISPIAESGFCTITGWTYTTADGKEARMDATTCTPANGGAVQPPNINGAPSGTSTANKAPMNANTNPPIDPVTGKVCGQGTDGFTIDGKKIVWPGQSVKTPKSSFLFSLGSYAPLYPTINGAFVYDLNLKKWGKMLLAYKLLLDYSPINSSAGGLIPANVFGILGGALGTDNKIRLFDTSPDTSYITYGKVGYYRLGNTSIEEVRVDFRIPSTGLISADTSLEGEALSPNLHKEQSFNNATSATLYGVYPGRWVNITISGIYDISYLEYRGFTQGRR